MTMQLFSNMRIQGQIKALHSREQSSPQHRHSARLRYVAVKAMNGVTDFHSDVFKISAFVVQ
jgi:hypothetical protein